jgi:hypothetical protein
MLVVTDADSGKIIGQPFPLDERVDANVYDPETGLIAAARREGAIHIIHEDSPDQYSFVEIVKTEFEAKTMGLDPQTHHLYLTTSDFGPAMPAGATRTNPCDLVKPKNEVRNAENQAKAQSWQKPYSKSDQNTIWRAIPKLDHARRDRY